MAPDKGTTRPAAGTRPAELDPAVRVTLERSGVPSTSDQLLWEVVKDRTDAIGFDHYKRFMDRVGLEGQLFRGVEAYQTLKTATRAWLQYEAGVWFGPYDNQGNPVGDPVATAFEAGFDGRSPAEHPSKADVKDVERLRQDYLAELEEDLRVLPYHKLIVDTLGALPLKSSDAVFGDYGISPAQLFRPVLLELIWSFWHEQGMLVQTMNAIARRFQNRRGPRGAGDPLYRLEIDPLRTVNNLLWGYVQDEWNLLSVQRRAYEYEHEYGMSLIGKAIPAFEPADTRPRFLTAFHDLLLTTAAFYDADDDTTVIADAFPVLNALRDVHAVVAEGAHNQFGDLTWTARAEMLVQQWILSRPEFREFLGGRTMVPFREPWMGPVETMRQLQGWGDASVTHFRDLGVFGERLLLTIRYGNWSAVNDASAAENWARFWRSDIKSYIHSYRAVTGADLSGHGHERLQAPVDGRYAQPSQLLLDRVRRPRRQATAPAGAAAVLGAGDEAGPGLPLPGERPRRQLER